MYRRLLAMSFAAVIFFAACGDDDDTDATSDTEPAEETTTTAADDTTTTADDGDGGGDTGADAPVMTASSDLGEILVDAEGFTLYGFTNDTDGTPTCTDDCAETWPPLYVDSEELPEGLDASVFSVVEHPNGQFQLAAGDWPLYLYAPDTAAGDTTGQGVGGVWFVVDPQGQLIME